MQSNKPIVILISALFLIASCGRGHFDSSLDTADSLLSTTPDSALSLLRTIGGEIDDETLAVRMRYAVLLADAMNKTFTPMDSASGMLPIMEKAARYYDSHGSANDRMRAHYLLGCVYRDNGEAPEALQYYHDAAACADTTAADCDYRLLARVYGQIADLFYDQLMIGEAVKANDLAARYALQANDSLSYISALSNKATALELTDHSDTIISIYSEVISLNKKINRPDHAAAIEGMLFTFHIKRGEFEIAHPYMSNYERYSGLFDPDREIEYGREAYYYYKGEYYIGIQQYDSAEYWLRKELQYQEPNNLEASFRGLYHLYKSKNIPDSMAKYADLAYQMEEKQKESSDAESMRHMQSLYDYGRYKNKAVAKSILLPNFRQG